MTSQPPDDSPAVEAVLFDLDGTLADRDRTLARYAARFLEAFGSGLSLDDEAEVAAELARIDQHGYNRNRARDIARHAAWVVAPEVDAIEAHWAYHFPRCSQGREGLLEILHALRNRGLALGLVSNGRSARQRPKLEVMGIEALFDVVLISEECGVAKPSPEIFLAAAAEVAVAPRSCLFVGDHPVKDIAGARSAGMQAVWISGNTPWPVDEAPPARAIRELREVLVVAGAMT